MGGAEGHSNTGALSPHNLPILKIYSQKIMGNSFVGAGAKELQ
jgi:hypothetical protein